MSDDYIGQNDNLFNNYSLLLNPNSNQRLHSHDYPLYHTLCPSGLYISLSQQSPTRNILQDATSQLSLLLSILNKSPSLFIFSQLIVIYLIRTFQTIRSYFETKSKPHLLSF